MCTSVWNGSLLPRASTVQAHQFSTNQKASMKYATVVTAAENLGQVPHMYYISQADEAGEPVQMGQLARVKFAHGVDAGCSEADLLGIVMHRLAAKAQESDVGGYVLALRHLDAALQAIGETLDVEEVKPGSDLTHLAGESVA